MKLDVFGRKIEVVKENGHWIIYELGEGKKTRSNGIAIPSDYSEQEVVLYLEDLLHEAATPLNPRIKVIG